MSDLISREAFSSHIKNVLGLGDEENGSDPEYMEGLNDCNEALMTFPSAENKGEWIPLYPSDPDLISFECKSCGEEQPFKCNFCPNCGADMRGENNC